MEPKRPDLVCFSHLRWDFVFQRPQHLLSRMAGRRRVFYVEEAIFDARKEAKLEIRPVQDNLAVAVPHLPGGQGPGETAKFMRELIEGMFTDASIGPFIAWYYTPMALPFTHHLRPEMVVYDCMDELSGFSGAPPLMVEMEAKLISRADLMFTGGASLYEAKRNLHARIHAFPSSIDKDHFARAQQDLPEPADQAAIPRPRIGFHGVIDERLDLGLLEAVAKARPDWHWVLVGPVCKIDPARLPKAANLHYLGRKDYADLPAYLSGWNAGMMPFAHNAATRFISPTKTPEYLAAGKAVVSTSIRDVVDPYGRNGLVHIADQAEEFIACCGRAMEQAGSHSWHGKVNRFLADISWERTWTEMERLMAACLREKLGPVETKRIGNCKPEFRHV